MFESLNPHDKPTAVLEILIMLVVAFIIGFVLAWLLKKSKHTQKESNGDFSKLVADNKEATEKIQVLNSEKKQLNDEIVNLKTKLEDCRAIGQNGGLEELVNGTVGVVAPSFVTKDIGIKPPSTNKVDDLKLISGVGAFIEKKLNAVGIYSFEQISKFDKKDIDTVTEAIEFFPGRIERDNWVGQAAELKDRV